MSFMRSIGHGLLSTPPQTVACVGSCKAGRDGVQQSGSFSHVLTPSSFPPFPTEQSSSVLLPLTEVELPKRTTSKSSC